jgi:hypothetical protein
MNGPLQGDGVHGADRHGHGDRGHDRDGGGGPHPRAATQKHKARMSSTKPVKKVLKLLYHILLSTIHRQV